MTASKDPQPTQGRLRASRACKACHERRVKCDAFEHGIPCTRCKRVGLEGCDFIKSRRGTYTRRKTGANHLDEERQRSENHSNLRSGETRAKSTSPQRQGGSRDQDIMGDHNQTEPWNTTGDSGRQRQGENQTAASDTMLPLLDLTTPDSQVSDTSRLSYREITWPSMFEHVLNSRRDQGNSRAIDKCSITYLGETFPLAMVLEDMKQGVRMRLHHPGPPMLDESGGQIDEQHPPHLLPEEREFLRAKGVFEYPSQDILSAFAATFLERVYPCYPIVNRKEFMSQLETKKLPWLLLHSFCFISSTFCPLAVLYRAKFHNRNEARAHYYGRAKALFNTGYEIDKIVILQSVILLAFWAGGPNDHWNFYSWNSTGVTIAEAMGIHRSMNEANLKKEDVSLLRRLWWVLAIRDASCGALIGRPFRINMYYCDTEMPTLDNFNDDFEDPEFAQHPLRDIFGLYQIHMAKLSLILREIVQQKYDVKNGRFAVGNLNESLMQWKKDLPDKLCLSHSDNVFSQCLAMAYDHHLILANLDKAAFTLPTPHEGRERASDSLTLVSSAAHRILNLACAMVRKSIQASMPHECFPALFLAEVVFYAQMRSPQPHRAALGQSAVNTCQMVWHNVLDTWDSAPWVMKLFDTLITNTQEDLIVEEPLQNIPQMAGHHISSFEMSDMEFGAVPELWQSHPMLSSMFDLPMDQSQMMNGAPSFMFAAMGDGGNEP